VKRPVALSEPRRRWWHPPLTELRNRLSNFEPVAARNQIMKRRDQLYGRLNAPEVDVEEEYNPPIDGRLGSAVFFFFPWLLACQAPLP